MSTKKAKPAGQYFCNTKEDAQDLLAKQNIIDLPGVGYAIQDKLNDMNVTLVEDVKKIPLYELQSKLGTKMGQTLYNFSRGIDDRPLTTNKPRQSVSAEVNWGVRFENEENEKTFIEELSKEVSERLTKHQVKGKTITIKILKRKEDATQAAKHLGHGEVNSFSKLYTLTNFTDDPAIISKHVYSMLKSFRIPCADIRGLGIQITRLDNQETISSDQGKLNFKSKVVPNDEGLNTEKKSVDTMEVGEPSTSVQKEIMEVDIIVYKELPESVQQELASNYNLKFIKSELTEATKEEDETKRIDRKETSIASSQEDSNTLTISRGSSFSELPPWSQLDPSALLAMPDKMREQVLQAYGNTTKKVKKVISSSPSRSANREISKLLPTSSPSSRMRNSSSVNASPSHSVDVSSSNFNYRLRPPLEFEEEIPYDIDIWNELPIELRTELLAEHHRLKRLRGQEQQNQELRNVHQEHLKIKDGSIQIKLEHIKEPSLLGSTDIDDIRTLLRNWVASAQDGPEPEDVTSISQFLKELVRFSNLEKTRLVIVYLRYLIKDYPDNGGWKQSAVEIQETVSKAVTAIYGCPLKF